MRVFRRRRTVWVKLLLPGLYTSTSRPFGPSSLSSPYPSSSAEAVGMIVTEWDLGMRGVRSVVAGLELELASVEVDLEESCPCSVIPRE